MYTQAPKRGGKHKHLIEEHYRFSVSGGYRAAIKKAASNTSQPGLLLNLDLNKTRQTISNWSSKLATNIRYQYRAWQTEQSDYISSSFEALRANAASLSSKVWSWRRTSIRADATNLPACQSFKGHVVEVDTKYAHIPSHILEQFVDLETFPPEPEPAAACVFSDIQQLPESTGANETLQMLEKQVENVGGQTWKCHEHDTIVIGNRPIAFHLDAIFVATDQGPDQTSAHNFIEQEVAHDPYILYFRCWCFLHVCHLMVKSHLKFIERVAYKSYFACVAKIINVWRSGSNMKKLKRSAAKLSYHTIAY